MCLVYYLSSVNQLLEFVINFWRLKSLCQNIDFDFTYRSNASSSVLALLTMSSTYVDLKTAALTQDMFP